jgi:hypothetical protein
MDAGLRRHDGVGRGRASSEAVISRRALSLPSNGSLATANDGHNLMHAAGRGVLDEHMTISSRMNRTRMISRRRTPPISIIADKGETLRFLSAYRQDHAPAILELP